jgi:hypothetical protein
MGGPSVKPSIEAFNKKGAFCNVVQVRIFNTAHLLNKILREIKRRPMAQSK